VKLAKVFVSKRQHWRMQIF